MKSVLSLPRVERDELRRHAFELFAAGAEPSEVARSLGISRQTAWNWQTRRNAALPADERKRGPETADSAAIPAAVRGRIKEIAQLAGSLDPATNALLSDTGFFRRFVSESFGIELSPQTARRWKRRLGMAGA